MAWRMALSRRVKAGEIPHFVRNDGGRLWSIRKRRKEKAKSPDGALGLFAALVADEKRLTKKSRRDAGGTWRKTAAA